MQHWMTHCEATPFKLYYYCRRRVRLEAFLWFLDRPSSGYSTTRLFSALIRVFIRMSTFLDATNEILNTIWNRIDRNWHFLCSLSPKIKCLHMVRSILSSPLAEFSSSTLAIVFSPYLQWQFHRYAQHSHSPLRSFRIREHYVEIR